MDFLEQAFGISLDGGNGMFEALCIASALVAITFVIYRRKALRLRRDAIGRPGIGWFT
jgi:hypothetical protein